MTPTGPTDAPTEALAPLPPHVIVLFGATGDLSRRKLLPGLLHLSRSGLMPAFRVIGTSRQDLDDDSFRRFAAEACAAFGREDIESGRCTSSPSASPSSGGQAGPGALVEAVRGAERQLGRDTRRLFYLSIPPGAATEVIGTLGETGLVDRARVVMEKPFGTDLASARRLNETVHQVFAEEQVFRIDHFLGKEAAQNILALRFANGLFEPIWNRDHIDHVEIDVPERLDVGGRASFYEQTGAFRDMVVTHLIQVLAFVAMEPPTELAPMAITEEKNKVFRSLTPLDPEYVVRGQYEGYRSEPGVDPDSQTETFIALRCEVDNWRWSGVPFYLRTGKRMAESARIISIAFREPPKSMFPTGSGVGHFGPDHLTFDLDESSRLSLSFYGKRPGPGHEAGQGQHAVLAGRGRLLRRHPRGLRAADPRRDERRPHPVHHRRGDREPLGGFGAAARVPAGDPSLPARLLGAGGDPWLIAPHTWRLPFERRWREATRIPA